MVYIQTNGTQKQHVYSIPSNKKTIPNNSKNKQNKTKLIIIAIHNKYKQKNTEMTQKMCKKN